MNLAVYATNMGLQIRFGEVSLPFLLRAFKDHACGCKVQCPNVDNEQPGRHPSGH